ncbi:hypothetical protein [Actinoplanes sp. RD1]|uniref:hypothetical protein n=1 Tax=Actinoplanes sp. RD1 TaxID=3064538 RepID=UPI0027408388|nr:hypothetical protein [Actinoplanes sp. RD1]
MVSPGDAFADVPFRFKVVNALPAAFLACLVSALALAGAPVRAPDADKLVEQAGRFGWWGAAAAAVVIAVAALLLEPLELASVRILEGYWPDLGPFRRLAEAGRAVQRRRKEKAQFLQQTAGVRGVPAGSFVRAVRRYPDGEDLLPTTLGNRLRAFESSAGKPYGIDAIELWPRLYFVLPDSALSYINRSRTQLDTACRLCLTFGVSALISAGLLFAYPLWWLLPGALVLAAVIAYQAALAAAENYGITVTAAVDVYRVRLLQEMRLDMPIDTEGERAVNRELGNLWGGSQTANVPYARADSDMAILLQDLRRRRPRRRL